MPETITGEQRRWWRIALELKLRKCHGDAFQDFFSTVMENLHGDDFVRVRAFGSLGDKGCDGYLRSTGQVFQCYGALNGDSGKAAYLIEKMGEDFAKADQAIPAIMKEWHMVHNLVEGLPILAVEKLAELQEAKKGLVFGFVGIEGFEERMLTLDPSKIEALLGVGAMSSDAQDLQIAEVRDLVSSLVSTANSVEFDVTAIRPVPPEKLKFNNLPGQWRFLVAGGWQNAHLVASYVNRHNDPLVGERIAQAFRAKYQYLKAQHLSPGAIMSALYESIVGVGLVTAARQVAAQAILAFLFESCDIFEEQPEAMVV